MIKVVFFVLAFVAMLLFVGELSIQFNPFKVSLPGWNKSLGYLLVVLGVSLLTVGEYGKGYAKGLYKGADMAIEQIKERVEQIKNKDHNGDQCNKKD